MATHSSILAWRIPWTEEPGGIVHGIAESDMTELLTQFPWWLGSKESACSAGYPGSIPGSGRFPGEGNGNPL